jgi:predicted transcriptional regulator of viral defense system
MKEENPQVDRMKLDLFFATHPVFTIQDLKTFFGGLKRRTSTLGNLLQYHQKKGHILLIKKGLYAVIPIEAQELNSQIDPYLITSKLADDALIGYHTALALHGKTNSIVNRFYYSTKTRTKKNLEFQGNVFQAVSVPKSLKNKKIGTTTFNRLGIQLLVTTLERTFVDILDRPYLCLSWEEICRAIDAIEYLNSQQVVEYTLLLSNKTTSAIVGFFMEMHQEEWMIPPEHLEMLKKLRPSKPVYLKRAMKGPQKLIPKWNLIVPEEILQKRWEEPHENI